MKTLIYTTLFIWFLELGCNAQKDMQKLPLIVQLEKGKNKLIQFDSLLIDPINLFMQDKPCNELSVCLQLELLAKTNNKELHTFLWSREKPTHTLNYPKAFENYTLSLNVSKNDKIEFVLDKIQLGQFFFLDFGQTINIENLQLTFKEAMDVMDAPNPNSNAPGASYVEYQIVGKINDEQKTFSFTSFNTNEGSNELVLDWKNYKIQILATEIDYLKLIVTKNE